MHLERVCRGLANIHPPNLWEFLQILKGAHGLTEAPRLWYLKAQGSLQDIGGEELMMAKATFVFLVVGQLVAIFIHMDEYISNRQPTCSGNKDDLDRSLGTEELAMYRSTLAKARWPVNMVVLELAYGVSVLAQHNTNKVGEIKVMRRS